ncbi:MAG: DNA-3-methyladenine glycosylase [Saprospiraceae bacterium]
MLGNDFDGSNLKRLPLDFFIRTDVVQIARELLGKVLVTEFDGQRTSGRITETEAYRAPDDRASHAFGNRRTARTEVMFQEAGRAYIYLCYGIHHLFNVVTAPAETAHAVLIRAIEPIDGIDIMQQRRYASRQRSDDLESSDRRARTSSDDSKSSDEYAMPKLTTGPGALSQALGLTTEYTGQSLLATDSPIWIEDWYEKILEDDIATGPRIGVDYAGECAAWHWRFWLKNSPFVKKGAT